MAEAKVLAQKKADELDRDITIRSPMGRQLWVCYPQKGERMKEPDTCGSCGASVPYNERSGTYHCGECQASRYFDPKDRQFKWEHYKQKPSKKRAKDSTRIQEAGYIMLLAKKNPKRPGSKSHKRFDLYRDGMSVQEFLRAGGTREDLRWDRERGYISIKGQHGEKQG